MSPPPVCPTNSEATGHPVLCPQDAKIQLVLDAVTRIEASIIGDRLGNIGLANRVQIGEERLDSLERDRTRALGYVAGAVGILVALWEIVKHFKA